MEEEGRERKFVIFTGAPGHGKSENIKEMIAPLKEPVFIYDQNNQKGWWHIPEIGLDDFARMKSGIYRCTDPDYIRFFHIANRWGTPGTIIIEDATPILPEKKDKVIYPILVGLRHKDVDLIMTTHTLSETPKYIIRASNEMILHKTGDEWSSVKKRFTKPDEAKRAFDLVNSDPDKYAWERIIIMKAGKR